MLAEMNHLFSKSSLIRSVRKTSGICERSEVSSIGPLPGEKNDGLESLLGHVRNHIFGGIGR